MKKLSVHDSKPEDSLCVELKGGFDPQAPREVELEPFIQALEKHARGWMPDIVKGHRQYRYSRHSFWKALEERCAGGDPALGFYRTKWPALDGFLGLWLPPSHPQLDVYIKVKPLTFFAEVERCHELVELVRAWACRYPVTRATAHSSDDLNLALSPHPNQPVEFQRATGSEVLDAVYWLNVFGPTWVEALGRERILSTPAWRVEELPNGSILLLTRPSPSDFASDESRLAQARALAHLRPDLDFHSLLLSLRQRSSLLAPVQPLFHPDLAPLLSRIVDTLPSSHRPQQIAAFNSWQPPEPQEWAPSSSALPSDVDDPSALLDHYDSLAEHLVALRHSRVPSLFHSTPESLSDLDFDFWKEDFPTRYSSEALEQYAIPAVGAYLGNVLVHHLGGQWIARQKLEQSQVLVGSRVWFPFARARHYLSSRQSLLDSSLSWLYLVARRHRPGC